MKKALVKYRLYIIASLLLLTIRVGLGSFFVSASDITPSNVLSAVNNERTNRNIPALSTNSKLSGAAQSKADDMITRHYFAHVDPDGRYIWDKIAAYGYTPYTILGENLAIDFSDTEGLISAWIDSPTHRENMLNASFRDQGMGVSNGDVANGQYSVAVVNTFGTQPSSPSSSRTVTQKPVAQTKTQPTPVARKIVPTPVAKTTPAPTLIPTPVPIPTVVAQTPTQIKTYPEFDTQSINITPTISNDTLNLHIYAEASGNVSTMTATVAGQTANLVSDGSGFSGNLSLQKYFDFNKSNLVLSATSIEGETTQAQVPLKNYSLPASQNPKNLTDFAARANNPDLYNVFAYVIIIFGALFVLFSIVDSVKSMKRTAGPLLRGSKIILILILLSTVIVVSWWH